MRVDTEDEISRVQREAATGNYDDEHAIRIRDQKIEEDENAAQQAMAQMANTLRMVSSSFIFKGGEVGECALTLR